MKEQVLDPLNDPNLLELAKLIKHWHLLAEQKLLLTAKEMNALNSKYSTDHDRAYRALMTWRQRNRKLKLEERIIQLENHFELRGEDKALERLREFVHTKPIGQRELLSDIHLRFLGATMKNWQLVAEKIGLPNEIIKKLSGKIFGKKLVPYQMLTEWHTNHSPQSMEHKVDVLINGLLEAGETILVDDIRERQRIWLGCI